MKTVLPERLSPVTASQTVAPPASSLEIAGQPLGRLGEDRRQPAQIHDGRHTNSDRSVRSSAATGKWAQNPTFRKWLPEVDAGRRRRRNVGAMLDRRDLEPLFFAPFVSSVMRVEPGWIDYNGHLNMAYYNVLFDRAVDEAFELLGCGLDYVKTRRHSCFTAEVHVRYLRELHAGDPVRVTFQLLDYDAKRMHYFEQLFHAAEGWVSATSENMSLHVDMAAGKTAPFPADVAALPRPDAGVARQSAAPGSRRPADRDAGEELSPPLPIRACADAILAVRFAATTAVRRHDAAGPHHGTRNGRAGQIAAR